MNKKRTDWKILIALVWLFFTVALAIWWMLLGYKHIQNQKSMILMEGATLIASLVAGGSFIIYLLNREKIRNERQKEFFGAFNHELKTSIASLRLKAEGLLEDLDTDAHQDEKNEVTKIIKDTDRLELQIENSLFLSAENNLKFFLEEIELAEFILRIHPFSNIEIQGSMKLMADKRALEVVIKNIMQNALVHGHADIVNIVINPIDNTLIFSGSKKEFEGQLKNLGKLYHRHTQTSRSGIGLYLVKNLCKKMNAMVEFQQDANQTLITIIKFSKVLA